MLTEKCPILVFAVDRRVEEAVAVAEDGSGATIREIGKTGEMIAIETDETIIGIVSIVIGEGVTISIIGAIGPVTEVAPSGVFAISSRRRVTVAMATIATTSMSRGRRFKIICDNFL